MLSEKRLTCVEAERLAIETVRRMGYEITDGTRATPGTPGVIVGSRTDGTSKHGLMVTLTCTTLGAEVAAKSDQRIGRGVGTARVRPTCGAGRQDNVFKITPGGSITQIINSTGDGTNAR